MGLLSPFVSIVRTLIEGVGKIPISELLIKLVSKIPELIGSIQEIIEDKKSDGNFSPEEIKKLVDSALEEFDASTGIEGLSLIPNMTKEKQELALDHMKEFMRSVLYAQYNINE